MGSSAHTCLMAHLHVIRGERPQGFLPASGVFRSGFSPLFVREGVFDLRQSSRCAWIRCATCKAWPSRLFSTIATESICGSLSYRA